MHLDPIYNMSSLVRKCKKDKCEIMQDHVFLTKILYLSEVYTLLFLALYLLA